MIKPPQINLYSTQAHPCSYLDGQEANTLFVDPNYAVTIEAYDYLARLGFRRSGNHLYRPHCSRCQACVPIRIPVASFKPSRQQSRVWKRNQDLEIMASEDIRSGEHYQLYERYINVRHNDGDMFPPDREQFDSFLATPFYAEHAIYRDRNAASQLLSNPSQITLYLEFREAGQLRAVAVTDVLSSGLSAVYTFFDPDDQARSLGVFAVLFQIELAKKLSLPYLYLGYWISESKKMSYKSQYRPHELYQNNEWQPVGDS